jgi:hypothetical protein
MDTKKPTRPLRSSRLSAMPGDNKPRRSLMRNILCLVVLVPVLALAAGNIKPLTAIVLEGGAVVSGTEAPPAVSPVAQGGPYIPPKALVGTIDTIGGTTYDYWTNDPILRMIVNSPGYGVHATWMYYPDTDTAGYPRRNMRYNFYDYTVHAWNWLGPDYMVDDGVNVFPGKAGYSNIQADPATGVAIVGCHGNGSGGIVPRVAKDVAPGAGIFAYADGEAVLGVCQWPPIAVGQDGQINIFPITAAYALSYSRIKADSWPTFSTPMTGIVPSPGAPTHNIAASKVSSKVSLVWETPEGVPPAAYQMHSTDGGTNWDIPSLLEPPVAYGGDTVTAYHWNSLFPWYDRQDRFHLVANLMPWWDTIPPGYGLYFPSQIWHYCPANDPAWSRIAVAYVDPSNFLYAPGINATLACRPSIGEDDDGNLFVSWEQFDTLNYEPVTSRLRADIWAARSTDNGVSWGSGLKLTDAGSASMRFPSVIDLAVEGDPSDTMFVIYEVDSMAGFMVQGEGLITPNPVVVQKVAIDLLPVPPPAVAEQPGFTPVRLEAAAKPNPFGGRAQISYVLPQSGNVSLVVYDAAGRPVQTLAAGRLAAGRYTATWDAKNAAAGVYFYTLTSGKTSITRKLVLAN